MVWRALFFNNGEQRRKKIYEGIVTKDYCSGIKVESPQFLLPTLLRGLSAMTQLMQGAKLLSGGGRRLKDKNRLRSVKICATAEENGYGLDCTAGCFIADTRDIQSPLRA